MAKQKGAHGIELSTSCVKLWEQLCYAIYNYQR